jgi:F5/8 type C domain
MSRRSLRPSRVLRPALLAALPMALGCGTPARPPEPAAVLLAEPEGELEPTERGAPEAPVQVGGSVLPFSVSASGHDGHAPELAADGQLATRWSHYGRGSWLQADLGSAQHVRAVQVAWYRGDHRSNRFTVSVSTDGARYTPVFTGASSGRTLAPERYAFRPQHGRFVRVTV